LPLRHVFLFIAGGYFSPLFADAIDDDMPHMPLLMP